MGKIRGKYICDYGVTDMYKAYKKTAKHPVTKEQYSKIVKKFNLEVVDLILTKSFEFRMPCRLGCLRIKKVSLMLKLDWNGNLKKNFLKVDWKITKNLWETNEKARLEKKLVYHLNKHSDGYYYKWFWDKSTSSTRNLSVYKLIPSRLHLRALTKLVTTNEEIDYYA